MRYHILNGDALAEKFPDEMIPGSVIVIRETFVEGPLTTNFSKEYWEKRKEFIHTSYDATGEEYDKQFISQLQLLDGVTSADEIFLWFEDDLFCITNMLFTVAYLLQKSKPAFYRIFPEADHTMWSGFGRATSQDLLTFYENRAKLDEEEVELCNQLWQAYANDEREKLKVLSYSDTHCFRFLPEVIQAHLDRKSFDGLPGRPQRTLMRILNNGENDFYKIFSEFVKTEAIYGFGDLQVYNMLDELPPEAPGT